MHKRAFTLVELLLVITILALLASLTMAAMITVKRHQMRTSTQKLMTNLGQAVGLYLSDYSYVPADFDDQPMEYLYHSRTAVGLEGYYEPSAGNLLRKQGPDWVQAKLPNAEVISDFYSPGNVVGRIEWNVHNVTRAATGAIYTHTVVIRSLAGTELDRSDDIAYVYTVDPEWVEANLTHVDVKLDGFDVGALPERSWVFLKR